MDIRFESADPLRIMDGTAKTHSDGGTVVLADKRQYRFYATRFMQPRLPQPGERPYPRKQAGYAVEVYAKGRTLPANCLRAEREAISKAFAARVRAWAERQ